MAISPDAVLSSFKELTDEEKSEVDRLEGIVDDYLNLNYSDDQVVTWGPPAIITLNQIRELSHRYRLAGWRVSIIQDSVLESTTFVFAKGFGNSGVTTIPGKAN